MRNGILGALLVLGFATSMAQAQALAVLGPPTFEPDPDIPWQPPRTELDDRPNLAPKGYAAYGQVDYLLWWTAKDGPVDTLFRQGTEGTLGLWLDSQQHFGAEIGGLWLDTRYAGSRGEAGAVGVHNDLTSRLWGAEVDGRCELLRGTYTHLDLLGGFRHLSLDETLSIAERDFISEAVTSDRFGTRNRFYGGQLGLEGEAHYGSWSVDVFGKVALGGNWATATVNGTTVVGGHATAGGRLASQAAVGRFTSDEFAAVPEVGVHFAYELTNNIRFTAGYGFLYFSDVARPVEQIDLLQRNTRSSLPTTSSDFWGQGISVGLEFRF
jgi:hypothetical protein